jgi:hypothetical protein
LYGQLVRSLDHHRSSIRAVLETEAVGLKSGYTNIESHVEDHPSNTYAVSLLLVFVDKAVVMDELLVIDVALTVNPDPHWTIDATGQLGTFIAEDRGISASDQLAMLADADAAAARVEAFMTASGQL